jgi:hypothetical protein
MIHPKKKRFEQQSIVTIRKTKQCVQVKVRSRHFSASIGALKKYVIEFRRCINQNKYFKILKCVFLK